MDSNEESRLQNFDDEDIGKSTSRLPARPLEPKRRRWSIVGVSTVTLLCSAALIALLRNLVYLLPHPHSFDLIPGYDTLSCDLTIPNNNTIENAFMINLRSASHLSFSQAKLIDVTWDLFIGQGGRLLMAWVSYRAYMDELVCLMETIPVSYELYNYLVFDTTSLLTTWKSTKALFQSKEWRSRAFLAWFAFATFYTLAFPTLMGAATGYVNPSSPGYKTNDGTVLTADSEDLIYCIPIPSGELIGLTNGSIVSGPNPANQTFYPLTDYSYGAPANASTYEILYNCMKTV